MNGGGHVTAAPPDQLFLTDCQQANSPLKKNPTRIIRGEKAQILKEYHIILHYITNLFICSFHKHRFEGQKRSFSRFLWMRTAICKWVWLRKIWRPQPVWARHCGNNPALWIKHLTSRKWLLFKVFPIIYIYKYTFSTCFDISSWPLLPTKTKNAQQNWRIAQNSGLHLHRLL